MRATSDDYLTVHEVAGMLRTSRFTVYRRIKNGEIQAVRVGPHGPLRVPRAAIDNLLIPAISTPESRRRGLLERFSDLPTLEQHEPLDTHHGTGDTPA